MHIIKLEAENVKRLEAVSIEPNGNMVVIGGSNGSGKSSTLDCIEYALGGKKRLCDIPLHKGADRGYIVLETDKYVVKRTFTEKDSYIEVTTKEGFVIKSPQDLLNTLVGDLSFDPLEFTRMEPKKQAEVIKRLLGLDFSKLDAEYQQIESDRRDVGRDGKQVKAMLDGIPLDESAPTSETVVSDLIKELEAARKTNAQNERCRIACEDISRSIDSYKAHIQRLEAELAEAKENLEATIFDHQNAKDRVSACVDIETEPITTQIQEAESINKRFREAQQRKEYSSQYNAKIKEYEGLTARLREIEASKAQQIADAKFPVPGVTFTNDGVMVNGIPFEQASSAEQLQIAVAMGLSANPELRVILIRDGSLLDENSMAAVAAMAEEYDADVWIERVGDGAEVSIVIQDGRVYENRMVSAESEEVV